MGLVACESPTPNIPKCSTIAVPSKTSRSTPGKQLLQNPLCTGEFGWFSWVSWYLVWSCRQEFAFLHSWLHIQCYLSRWRPRTFSCSPWKQSQGHSTAWQMGMYKIRANSACVHKWIAWKKHLHNRMPPPSDCRSSSYGPCCRISHGLGEVSSLPRRSSLMSNKLIFSSCHNPLHMGPGPTSFSS